ncbi:MAG: hypothetical protein ACFCBU_05990 [Cyanophyceae cyanobacterium]
MVHSAFVSLGEATVAVVDGGDGGYGWRWSYDRSKAWSRSVGE